MRRLSRDRSSLPERGTSTTKVRSAVLAMAVAFGMISTACSSAPVTPSGAGGSGAAGHAGGTGGTCSNVGPCGGERLIDRPGRGLLPLEADSTGQIGLRVGIDEKDALFAERQRCR